MVTVVCIVMYQRHDYRFYSIILLLVLPTVTVTLSNHVTCCWYCVLLRAYLAAAADRQLTSVNIAINRCSFSVHATNAYTKATQWSTQHCRFNRGCVGGLGKPPSTHWIRGCGRHTANLALRRTHRSRALNEINTPGSSSSQDRH